MIYLSFFKLYFSSTFNYVQFNHIKIAVKVPVLPSAPHVRLPNRQCHAFLQERLQNAVKRSKNWKPCTISRGRAQKMCVHSLLKKVAEESKKKINLLISDAPEMKWVSCLCFHSDHTDATLWLSLNVRSWKTSHSQLSVLFLFYLFAVFTTSIL